jgi:hypothetical protein
MNWYTGPDEGGENGCAKRSDVSIDRRMHFAKELKIAGTVEEMLLRIAYVFKAIS